MGKDVENLTAAEVAKLADEFFDRQGRPIEKSNHAINNVSNSRQASPAAAAPPGASCPSPSSRTPWPGPPSTPPAGRGTRLSCYSGLMFITSGSSNDCKITLFLLIVTNVIIMGFTSDWFGNYWHPVFKRTFIQKFHLFLGRGKIWVFKTFM